MTDPIDITSNTKDIFWNASTHTESARDIGNYNYDMILISHYFFHLCSKNYHNGKLKVQRSTF